MGSVEIDALLEFYYHPVLGHLVKKYLAERMFYIPGYSHGHPCDGWNSLPVKWLWKHSKEDRELPLSIFHAMAME